MLDQGSPKAMVDMYKQLLVRQNPLKQAQMNSAIRESQKKGFQMHPNTLEYGEKQAEIVDFVVLDS